MLDAREDPDFNPARGLVLCGRQPGIPGAVSSSKFSVPALNHGLLVYVLAANKAIHDHIRGELGATVNSSELQKVQVWSRIDPVASHECAEHMARHDPGPDSNRQLRIELSGPGKLTPDQDLLVRRAFTDCSIVTLTALPGGRSANVFSVDAMLKASEAGLRPLPYFMKVDVSNKILAEVDNYRMYAAQHIPWYLRPNLDPSRCVKGTTQGILVGSFVENSKSLWDAVLQGSGSRQIRALFEDTLRAWRSQAHQNVPQTGQLASALVHVFKWDRVQQDTLELARTMGTAMEPKQLWEMALNLPDQQWRVAPMHGDMHGENVRVRGEDSIIIDLAQVANGPLCADLASLEVWLACEVPPQDCPQPAWESAMKVLFPGQNAVLPAGGKLDAVEIKWLRECVAETRRISASICECDSEYATAVALNLLRRAQYPSTNEVDRFRRAYAYMLGSQLVMALGSNSFS
jgi:hypothetical protein